MIQNVFWKTGATLEKPELNKAKANYAETKKVLAIRKKKKII